MENANHTVTQWAPDLWQFDEAYQDAYLVVGQERAVLIDCMASLQEPTLWEEIRSRTALPVDVLLTHAHFDHAGQELARLAEHEDVHIFLGLEDFPIYENEILNGVPVSRLTPFSEGEIFDLGDVQLEAIRVEGHTPGSYVFLDRAGRRALTGDALGIWIQLPHSLSVETYRRALGRFADALTEIPEPVFYTGHLSQCGGALWKPDHVKELLEICDMLLSGELEGDEPPQMPPMEGLGGINPFEGARVVRYKSVWNFAYRPDRLRDE